MKKKLLIIIPVLLLLSFIVYNPKTSYSLNNTDISLKELNRNNEIMYTILNENDE